MIRTIKAHSFKAHTLQEQHAHQELIIVAFTYVTNVTCKYAWPWMFSKRRETENRHFLSRNKSGASRT